MELLNKDEIDRRLPGISGWALVDNAIEKDFTFDDFRQAMAFMVRTSYEAEDMNHHPDWTNVYNRIKVRLNTHDAGGVTEKDFELAARIDGLA